MPKQWDCTKNDNLMCVWQRHYWRQTVASIVTTCQPSQTHKSGGSTRDSSTCKPSRLRHSAWLCSQYSPCVSSPRRTSLTESSFATLFLRPYSRKWCTEHLSESYSATCGTDKESTHASSASTLPATLRIEKEKAESEQLLAKRLQTLAPFGLLSRRTLARPVTIFVFKETQQQLSRLTFLVSMFHIPKSQGH